MNPVSHLTDEALRRNAKPLHFSAVIDSGDIVAHDDSTHLAVTWRKKTNDFTLWAYGTGQFVKAGKFQAPKKPDRTRTAEAVAKKTLKSLRKELAK